MLALSLEAAGLESLRSAAADPVHPNERGHLLIAQALEPLLAAKLTAEAPAPR